jgi:phosphoribosyl 1,2-cyclic phosphate phosphodiesterase
MNATLTVLGSGTSMGVPTLGCECAVCRSSDPRDRRSRPSVLVDFGGNSVLIDTTPDFREQALREKIRKIDAVLYTHAHADHVLGLDDLRPLSFLRPNKIPLYAAPEHSAIIHAMFRYAFDGVYKFGSLPQVELKPLDGPLDLFGARFEPVSVLHGDAEVWGFRFGSAAYLTDFSEVPESSLDKLRGLDVLFLDALRHTPHPTHSNIENSLRIAGRLGAKRTFFTHICHDLGHEETNRMLPAGVQLAYDGLKLEFEI